ncbi:MAG: hypothetical protein ACREQ5_05435 [Candidatus Dormibacteria bacterium]
MILSLLTLLAIIFGEILLSVFLYRSYTKMTRVRDTQFEETVGIITDIKEHLQDIHMFAEEVAR